jgi:hypothetical protein
MYADNGTQSIVITVMKKEDKRICLIVKRKIGISWAGEGGRDKLPKN